MDRIRQILTGALEPSRAQKVQEAFAGALEKLLHVPHRGTLSRSNIGNRQRRVTKALLDRPANPAQPPRRPLPPRAATVSISSRPPCPSHHPSHLPTHS